MSGLRAPPRRLPRAAVDAVAAASAGTSGYVCTWLGTKTYGTCASSHLAAPAALVRRGDASGEQQQLHALLQAAEAKTAELHTAAGTPDGGGRGVMGWT